LQLLNKVNFLIISPFLNNEGWSVGNAHKRNEDIIFCSDEHIIGACGKSGGTFNFLGFLKRKRRCFSTIISTGKLGNELDLTTESLCKNECYAVENGNVIQVMKNYDK
jgi:hypothetical protein